MRLHSTGIHFVQFMCLCWLLLLVFVCICKSFNRRFLLLYGCVCVFFSPLFCKFFFSAAPSIHHATHILYLVFLHLILLLLLFTRAVWLLCISMLFVLTSFGQCDLQAGIATSENAVHSIFQWMDNVLEWQCCCCFHFIWLYTMFFFLFCVATFLFFSFHFLSLQHFEFVKRKMHEI